MMLIESCDIHTDNQYLLNNDQVVPGLQHSTQDQHKSVLLCEVLEHLAVQPAGIYVDATFGLGGYSAAILESDLTCQVIAIDRDPHAKFYADILKQKYGSRFNFYTGCFSQLTSLLSDYRDRIDGLVFDLGVSSPQLDQPERGFSFRFDGPLDMCMSNIGLSAADIVNTYSESDLLYIIRTYGEEKRAKQIVRAIITARTIAAITTTLQLSTIIEKVIPKFLQKIHPATRTFQALRIAVNSELNELHAGLDAALTLLQNQGRLVVVSFHSLEDRIVKQFIQKHSTRAPVNRFDPGVEMDDMLPSLVFKKLTRRAVTAGIQETLNNPRARSAKLRAAVRHCGSNNFIDDDFIKGDMDE